MSYTKSSHAAMADLSFYCSDGTELPVIVRISTRASRQRIILNSQGQLEVVLPAMSLGARRGSKRGTVRGAGRGTQNGPGSGPGAGSNAGLTAAGDVASFNLDEVETLLEANRSWVERAAIRTRAQREAYQLSKAAGLPTHLEFPPIGELWLLEYHATSAQKVSLKRDGLRLVCAARQPVEPGLLPVSYDCKRFRLKLSGATHNEEDCISALKRFIHQRAKETLPAFGWRICDSVGARPRAISVSNRKTAWGLCSRDGSIKLDRKLLFLPKDLAVQVVLHEIAHLQQMNHSKRFYDRLFSLEGSSKEAEHALKSAMAYIPAWLR